jgi:DNA repair protein RecO (recombination protein O)
MEWTDEGIVLGIRRHGEANAIVELMTRGHGRHLGLVRGGAGSRMRPVLQPGKSVSAVWRARLDEHLGTYAVEGLQLRAGSFLTASHAVYAVTHLGAMTRLLPERDPHEEVFHRLQAILDHVDDAVLTAALVVRFEIALLSELGFGLDLDQCAATGSSSDLAYVSPKSGRAVSAAAGEEWRDKLLTLPEFLRGEADARPTLAELGAGFALSEFFLARNVLDPRGMTMPEARQNFIAAVARVVPDAA